MWPIFVPPNCKTKKLLSRLTAAHMHRNKLCLKSVGARIVTACFLEASSPSKNLVQGNLRTQLWWQLE
jgi:transposase